MANNEKDMKEKMYQRANRETMIAMVMLAHGNKGEMTVDEVTDAVVKEYPKEKMNANVVSQTLKSMYSSGLLARERRKSKKYIDGHQKTVSIFFYKPEKELETMMEMARKAAGSDIPSAPPEFELAPPEMKGRPAFSTPTKLSDRQREVVKMKEKVDKVMEITKPIEKKEPMGKTVQEMFAQMTFQEALMKLYTGHRVVSAVSGNVYSMMDNGNQKGITSSAKPGIIISFFPANEMEGMWREMEMPKTCPFCDSQVKLVEFKNEYMYKCTNDKCCMIGPKARTPEEAVKKFNTRRVE